MCRPAASNPSDPAPRTRRTRALRTDRRGVAAMEGGLVMLFLIALFLPITDFVVAAVRMMGAYQAMRDLGAYALFHLPPDVTNATSWSSGLPRISGYSITTTVLCGDPGAECTDSTVLPKYLSFQTTVTLSPMFVTSLRGSYTLTHSERFQ